MLNISNTFILVSLQLIFPNYFNIVSSFYFVKIPFYSLWKLHNSNIRLAPVIFRLVLLRHWKYSVTTVAQHPRDDKNQCTNVAKQCTKVAKAEDNNNKIKWWYFIWDFPNRKYGYEIAWLWYNLDIQCSATLLFYNKSW